MTQPEPHPCPTCARITEPWSWCAEVQRYECETCDEHWAVSS